MGTSFKDQIKADISSVFLNGLEFADDHELNGKTMKAVIDDNELLERDKAKVMSTEIDGIHKTRRFIYVAKADFGPRNTGNCPPGEQSFAEAADQQRPPD